MASDPTAIEVREALAKARSQMAAAIKQLQADLGPSYELSVEVGRWDCRGLDGSTCQQFTVSCTATIREGSTP